jgi:hypothetical protein
MHEMSWTSCVHTVDVSTDKKIGICNALKWLTKVIQGLACHHTLWAKFVSGINGYPVGKHATIIFAFSTVKWLPLALIGANFF